MMMIFPADLETILIYNLSVKEPLCHSLAPQSLDLHTSLVMYRYGPNLLNWVS